MAIKLTAKRQHFVRYVPLMIAGRYTGGNYFEIIILKQTMIEFPQHRTQRFDTQQQCE